MIYRSDEIKFAMQYLAVQKGRPHYELGIVKQVVNAFRDGADHFLKSEVLEILKVKFPGAAYRTNEDAENYLPPRNKPLASQKQFNEFYSVTRSYLGAIRDLSNLSGVSAATLSSAANRGEITLERYKQLKPYFKKVKKCKI